jgi:hypothetical protein
MGSKNHSSFNRPSVSDIYVSKYRRRYLKRWGFTPKRPAKKAREQKPEAIELFEKETFSEFRARRKREKGIEIVLDETGLNNASNVGRSYSPRGERRALDLSAQKFSKNIIISSSNEGYFNYMTYDQSMNTKQYIKFLERLIKRFYGRKIFLMADNYESPSRQAS